MVGPLSVHDAKAILPDLEEFISSSGGQGFMIASFGTNVASPLSEAEVDLLALVFGKLKQRVVWRLKGTVTNKRKLNTSLLSRPLSRGIVKDPRFKVEANESLDEKFSVPCPQKRFHPQTPKLEPPCTI